MAVNGRLAGPEIHFEIRYYFAINELFITNFYCIYIYIYIYPYYRHNNLICPYQLRSTHKKDRIES